MITLRAAIFLSYDPSSGYKIVSTQYLEFEMCLVSPIGLIFKTFCEGGWFIGDGGACLKLEKQPFICLFISLTAFNTEKLSDLKSTERTPNISPPTFGNQIIIT